jgi:hypothetical protein
VLAALAAPAREAFRNLRTAALIPPRPGYVPTAPGFVWARRSDVDLLLSEVTVSVGIEVELLAAKQALASIDKMFFDYIEDPERLVDETSRLLHQYFGKEIDEADRNTDDGSFPVNTRVRYLQKGTHTGVVVFRGDEHVDTNWRTVKFDVGGQYPCRVWYLEEIDADGNLVGRPAPGPPSLLG